MALIKCPECEKEISDKVRSCPHCGYPLQDDSIKETSESSPQQVEITGVKVKKATLKTSIIVLLGIIIISLGIFIVFPKVNEGFSNKNLYTEASELLETEKYLEAREIFISLGDYKDSTQKVIDCENAMSEIYNSSFDDAAVSVYVQTLIAQLKCYYISQAWDDAIDSTGDWDEKDFNEEIRKLLTRWEEKDLTKQAEDSKNEIDEKMKLLRNPESSFKDAYNSLVEMYGIYIQLYDQSKSPSGSLLTFNQNINELSSNFEKVYNQIIIIRPEIKDKVEIEKDEIDPKDY